MPVSFDTTANTEVKARLAAAWALYFFIQYLGTNTGDKSADAAGKLTVMLLGMEYKDTFSAGVAELGGSPFKEFNPSHFMNLLTSILVPAKESTR